MKVFWDTNLFIYLWEGSAFRPELERLQSGMARQGAGLATSTLTVAEILVQPRRLGRMDLYEQYLAAFDRLELIGFDRESAKIFADLRARYPSLRPPDAIQLACAATGGCETFVTNDTRLAKVTVPGIRRVESLCSGS